MATYEQRGKKWRVQIARDGKRISGTFASKGLARAWATEQEAELLAKRYKQIPPHTVLEALQRYSSEVSPTKGGAHWEQIRLKKFERELGFAGRLLTDATRVDVSEWRDRMLKSLAGASVRREMTLLRSVFEICRRDWGWLAENPMTDVVKPPSGKHRTRRLSAEEVRRMLLALDYEHGEVPVLKTHYVAVAMLWALETAMRAGEICALEWSDMDLEARAATVRKSKNGDERVVPLSREAIQLLEQLPKETERVFDVAVDSLDTLFRKARKRAVLSGFTFHDTRHTAITRLARHLGILDLARMIGHRDLKSLMIYYNPTAKEIAQRLDQAASL